MDAPCYEFRCYEDDNFPLLQLSTEDCEYILTSTEEEIALPGFSLSPNPAPEYVSIYFRNSVSSSITSLKLYNASGTLVKTTALQPGTKELALDVAAFPPGLYLLVYIENGLVVQREKVVVQRGK